MRKTRSGSRIGEISKKIAFATYFEKDLAPTSGFCIDLHSNLHEGNVNMTKSTAVLAVFVLGRVVTT